ncbi:MAG: Stp1/IreP family PP2C-type Ser/Thr phosphatase [Acidimicrobiales bacterium]
MTRLVAGSATDVGLVRAVNQDHLLVAEPLFAVADGMGGHAAGEVASETAVEALRQAVAGELRVGGLTLSGMADAVHQANRAVWEEAQANPDLRGMGTTLTAIALVEDGDGERLAVANVGDSRTYRLRDGRLEQLTVDHSLVAELIAEGQIQPDEAETHPQRHVLTRALGVYPDVEVDVLSAELRPEDRLLLCSDGLSRELAGEQIASLLRRYADPAQAAGELVATARRHGGSDNITAVVVDVVADDAIGADVDGVEAMAAALAPVAVGSGASVATPAGATADDTQAVDLTAVRAAIAAPAADVEPTPAAAVRPRRRERRRAALGPPNRLVTPRVVLFFLVLVALVGLAYGGTAWYARSSYFVGIHHDRLTIYQGRPGGVLWWHPTVAEVTGVTTSQVESVYLPQLRKGVEESSIGAARTYVANVRNQARAAGIGSGSTTGASGAPVAGDLGEGLT